MMTEKGNEGAIAVGIDVDQQINAPMNEGLIQVAIPEVDDEELLRLAGLETVKPELLQRMEDEEFGEDVTESELQSEKRDWYFRENLQRYFNEPVVEVAKTPSKKRSSRSLESETTREDETASPKRIKLGDHVLEDGRGVI